MLSEIMFVLERLRSGLNTGIDGFGTVGHFCHLFQHNRVVNGLMGVLSPGKGAVVLAENCRNSNRILSHRLKFIYNQMTGIFLIGLVDFLFGQTAQAGNFSVNIVRMGGSVAGNAPAGLRQLVA